MIGEGLKYIFSIFDVLHFIYLFWKATPLYSKTRRRKEGKHSKKSTEKKNQESELQSKNIKKIQN